jgi:hypothetical protein
MENLKIYCVTNKEINYIEKKNYNFGWVGKEPAPNGYISCRENNDIFDKEKYYSELTFHYWYWKNLLSFETSRWVGFCQKRRYWIKEKFTNNSISIADLKTNLLDFIPETLNNYDAFICEPINVNNVKKIKLLKRGFQSIIKNPSLLFDSSKQSLILHFDMHHGYGNLKKSIEFLDPLDQSDFYYFVKNSTAYNPHIMFISKPSIINSWFSVLFPWLKRCEKHFGFKDLKGYDTQRLYAYLAERYLSFWFQKYTNYRSMPWIFFDMSK